MTFEHFWQWIHFLIWFKLVYGSSRHMWLYSKSRTLSRYTKGFIKRAENKHKKQRQQMMTKGGKAHLWPEGKGEGSLQKCELQGARLSSLRVPANQAVGSPSRDLEVSTESVVGLPWARGGFTQLSRHFHDASYLQDRWCLIEQQIHWIK